VELDHHVQGGRIVERVSLTPHFGEEELEHVLRRGIAAVDEGARGWGSHGRLTLLSIRRREAGAPVHSVE
jgi:hypothetical protein